MTRSRTSRRTAAALAPLLLGVLLVGAACSTSDSGGDSSAAEPAAAAPDGSLQDGPELGAPDPGAAFAEDSRDAAGSASGGADSGSTGGDGSAARPPVQTRAVISTGTVSLASEDVGATRFDVQKIVDGHRGEVTDEQTATDDDGAIVRSRLVLRVPSDQFSETMDELEQVAGLRSAKRTSEDVTTQVIDIDVRVRAQEQSLERVEVLLARARSIRDIVAIEAQLTRRQAELDSLKQQQAWLADQTSLSTITVFLEREEEAAAKKEKDDETGFVAGLEQGWHALATAATGFATALGTLLPFLVLLLLVGLPAWLITRAVARRHRPATPTPAG